MKKRADLLRILAAFVAILPAVFAAEMQVKGLGWFGDRDATRSLELLLGE